MEKDLIIKAPSEGIGASPLVGYGDVRNLDIHTQPGSVRINNLAVKQSGSIVIGSINWLIRNPLIVNEIWGVDGSDRIYKSWLGSNVKILTGNTGSGYGSGLAIWKDYLFVGSGTALDCFGPLSGKEITGTVSSSGTAITGSGTAFDTELAVDDWIMLQNATNATTMRKVTVITDATHLTLDAAPASTWSESTIVSFKWTKAFQTIDTSAKHPLYISKLDDKLYGGAGRYIFSIDENSGQTFAPATAATFTFTSRCDVDLPSNYIITCFEELGNNLMIGTGIKTGITQYKIADIFPWDTTSSFFGQPISLNECGISAMITVNSILYIFAGTEGKIFSCNGTQTFQIAQIPIGIANTEQGYALFFYPGSVANYKGRIFFGVGNETGALTGGIGIWSLLPGIKNILTFEHTISTGNSGVSYKQTITALCPVRYYTLCLAWYDATPTAVYGIDRTDETIRCVSYAAYFESPLYSVGTPLNKRKFTNACFQLAKELATDQAIRISYRVNLTDSFTVLGTYTYAILGAVNSHSFPAEIPECEFLQIKVELTTASSSATSPEFIKIILQ